MSSIAEITAARNTATSMTVLTSSSFTPNGDRVLFIVADSSRGGAVADATIAGLGGASALTITRIPGTGSPALANRIQVWRVTTPSSPSSMSFQLTFSNTQLGGAITVYEGSSDFAESDIVAEAGAGANSAAASVDVGTPATDSTLVGFLFYVNTATITEGTGYTPLTTWTWLASAQTYAQYDETADADGVIDASLASASNWHFIGIEIQATGGDVTAPTLSSPTDASTGGTTGSGSVSTNEGNGTLYFVVTTSATSPSAAQVKAGNDHTGSAAVDSGSQAVSGTGVQNISGGFTGLTSETQYYAHYMHEDAATNQSSVSSADGFTTDDVTAPTLSSPTDAATGSTTGSGSVSTNEDDGTLYFVVTQSATSPSAAQVKAGNDHTGSAADDSGSQAVSGTGVQNVSGGFTGLTASTGYFAHYMHEDAATNQSSVSSADGFTTNAPPSGDDTAAPSNAPCMAG